MLELRDYQHRAFDLIREEWRKGNKRVMLYGPCSFGKTELAIAMMNAARENKKKSAMILDRIVLCDQTSKRLDKYGIYHGVMQAGHWRYRPHEEIQVCSVQTLNKRGDLPATDFYINDEAHCLYQFTKEFMKNSDKYFLGLSGSPFTKGLADVYDSVVSCVTIKEMEEQGWLVPLKVYFGKETDMEGAKKVAGEWSVKDVTERGTKIIGDVVSEWEKMTNLHFGKPEKTIVFSAGVAHGEALQNEFRARGYNFINISYRDDDDFKYDVLEDFGKPDTDIVGVIATDIMTKGADFPAVRIGVSCRPFSKSFQSHVQQKGRIQRPFPGKEYGLWLDHGLNCLRFWEDWENLYHNGVQTLSKSGEKTKKEPTKKEKEATKCPQCHALWMGGDTCAECGFKVDRKNKVICTPGELVALEEKDQKQLKEHNEQEWYSMLLGYVTESNERHADRIKKGKKAPMKYGWAAFQFKKKFGHFPDGLAKKQKPPTLEVKRYVQYLFIRQSKRA